MKKILIPFTAFAILFASCSSDDDSNPISPTPADYENGVLITNEGPFGNGTGTLTFVSDDFATVEQNVYRNVNGSDLGNIVQSMGFANNDAYIVVSNSQKVMVADRYTLEVKDSIIDGFQNPRYFVSGQNKGYVTDWGDPNDNNDDYVAVIDLTTNTIAANIAVPFGPEKVVAHNNKIYVAHQGGYGFNNLVSVISGTSIQKSITVGDVPSAMTVVGNYLYVLGSGNPDYSGAETAGTLSQIDLDTDEVVATYSFDTNQHPNGMASNGSSLFYGLNGEIHKTDIESIDLSGNPIINGFFYAMEVHDNLLYATDAGDYASRGSLYVYDLSTTEQIQDIQTGIIPGNIYFND